MTTKSRKSAKTLQREADLALGVQQCAKCDHVLPLSNFRSAKTKSGVTSYCRPCEEQYKLEWHLKRRSEVKNWIYHHLKTNPCVDCGESDVLALDFDHVKGARKRYNIAHAFMISGMTIKRLQTEIAKCDVRCGKCHRIRTHMVSKSWKYRMAIEKGDA